MNLAQQRRLGSWLLRLSLVPFAVFAFTLDNWSQWAVWLGHPFPYPWGSYDWYWWVGSLALFLSLTITGARLMPAFWEGRNRFTTSIDDEAHALRVTGKPAKHPKH